jgi:hypothetical protein
VVTDADAMAEGEGPPVPGEDGVAARSEDDVCSISATSLEEAPGA